MGRHCVAYGCSNSDEKNKKLGLGLTFHLFPTKHPSSLKVAWEQAVKRKNFKATQHSVLCSEHFTKDDFRFQPFTGQRQVKPGAVPSSFVFTPTKPTPRKRTSYEIGSNVMMPTQPDPSPPSHMEGETQTDLTAPGISQLEDQVFKLEAENKALRLKVEKGHCSFFTQEDSAIRDLCGFTREVFLVIFSFFMLEEKLTSKTRQCKLAPEDQLFLTLIKLRQGFTDRILAVIFQMKLCSVQNVFKKCLITLYRTCKTVPIWPSKEQVQAYMPPNFQKYFPACRVIIDATEFYIQKPGNPTRQQASFSSYKNSNTLKALIGIAPSGAISFISDLWLGGISDQQLTRRCGLIDYLEAGDTVMADRGFTSLTGELEEKGITLSTPTFLRDKIQFQVEERGENKRLSSHRCHVERAIGKLKRFKILYNQIPAGLKTFEEMYFVCAFLSNFSEPLINCGSMDKK